MSDARNDTQEVEATLALPPIERYSYLVHRIAGSEQAWGLRSEEGWVLINDDSGDAFGGVGVDGGFGGRANGL